MNGVVVILIITLMRLYKMQNNFKSNENIDLLIKQLCDKSVSDFYILCLCGRLIELCLAYDLTTTKDFDFFVQDSSATNYINFSDLKKTH